MDFHKGKIIKGQYVIQDSLGKGGMGEVFRVYDRKRSVDVAMKVLVPDLAEDVPFVIRFKREAKTLASLKHPNIIQFYELVQEDDALFLIMDYIDGPTLKKEILRSSGKPMNYALILRVMRAMCIALHFVHSNHKVHCDVKPANIMLNKNGRVFLSDFGISQEVEGTTTSTMAGAGAPAYMAPEQIRGKNSTPQTDIYSLGIVLYEMLTGGNRPFMGERGSETATTKERVRWEKLHCDPISPRAYNPAISDALEAIVFKCLSIKPRDRFSSTLQLLNDLVETPDFQNIDDEQLEGFDGPISDPDPQENPLRSYLKKITTWWRNLQPRNRGYLAIGGCLLLVFGALLSLPSKPADPGMTGRNAPPVFIVTPNNLIHPVGIIPPTDEPQTIGIIPPTDEPQTTLSMPATYTPQPTYTPYPTYTSLPVAIQEPTESKRRDPTNHFNGMDVIPITEDYYIKFNSLLISHARKYIDTQKLGDPGTFRANFELKSNASYGIFTYCSEKEEYRQETISKLRFTIEIDGIPANIPDSKWIYHTGSDGKVCILPAALVTHITPGTYHIVITEKKLAQFSGHIGGFPPGDYVYEMTITFK